MSETHNLQFGALGDSVSIGFNAELNGLNERHSWATGDLDVAGGGSHLTRIRRLYPQLSVNPINVAAVGAKSIDLNGQVDQLLQRAVPDYVTLMIGANDLTAWLSHYSDHAFSLFMMNVRSVMQRLMATNPRVMILIAGIPDQSRVLTLFAKQQLGPSFEGLLETWIQRPDLQRLVATYKEKWTRANRFFSDLTQTYPQNIRYSAAVATTVFSDEHLSRHDFYHPSILGQRLLAEITWRDGFFP